MKAQPLDILFFVAGSAPTTEERLAAMDIPHPVKFRNAAHVVEGVCLETAHGVAGAVPEQYAHYPTAEEAIKEYKERLRKHHSGLPDVGGKAPAQPAKQPAKAPEPPKPNAGAGGAWKANA